MELAADISGVCKVVGTLLMTSKPTSRLKTKMLRSVRNSALTRRSPFSSESCRRPSGGGTGGGTDDLARVRDDDAGLDRVVEIDGELAVAYQVPQQRDGVAGVGGGRGARHRGGQVVRADHRHPVLRDDRLARRRSLDVAAEVARGEVDHDR